MLRFQRRSLVIVKLLTLNDKHRIRILLNDSMYIQANVLYTKVVSEKSKYYLTERYNFRGDSKSFQLDTQHKYFRSSHTVLDNNAIVQVLVVCLRASQKCSIQDEVT